MATRRSLTQILAAAFEHHERLASNAEVKHPRGVLNWSIFDSAAAGSSALRTGFAGADNSSVVGQVNHPP